MLLRLLTVQENKLGIREKKVNWFLGKNQMDIFLKGHKDFKNSSDYSEWLANFNYFRLMYLMFPINREMFNLGCFIAYFMFKHWTQKQLFALLILNTPEKGTLITVKLKKMCNLLKHIYCGRTVDNTHILFKYQKNYEKTFKLHLLFP